MSSTRTLLESIQEGAVSSSVPVAELLRRCQVLAARLRVPDLAAWVQHELNGYSAEAALPEYRIIPGLALGHFSGPFGSGIRNAVLPARNLPESLRHWAREVQFREAISSLEEIARREQDHVRCAWPGDLVALVQMDFYENMALGQAWLSISKSSVVGAIETVRNRILTFSLETEVVSAVEDAPTPATSGAISQVFNTVIYGDVSNLAQASANSSQSVGVASGDLEGLLRAVSRLGVSESDSTELQRAIADDGPPGGRRIGSRVASWIGMMVSKAVAGTWTIATSTATTVLPKLVERYYGLSE